jgi:hypothetical protein
MIQRVVGAEAEQQRRLQKHGCLPDCKHYNVLISAELPRNMTD